MKLKRREGGLPALLASMKVSRPIYFLMLACLVAGLVLLYMPQFTVSTVELPAMLDEGMIDEVGSLLEDGELVEKAEELIDFVEEHGEDGAISFTILDVCTLADVGYLQIVLILVYAAGMIAALLPLVMDCEWKERYLIPAILAPVASMALLMYICVKYDAILSQAVRTMPLVALIVISVMNLIFASGLVIGLVTSDDNK